MEWRTVDVPTHPLKDGRWVAVLARIRNNATGEIREYTSHEPLYAGDVHPHEFIWTDGNYGCDCNRSLFFGYAAGLTPDEIDEHECGEGAYSVQLANPVDGSVYYDELSEPATE